MCDSELVRAGLVFSHAVIDASAASWPPPSYFICFKQTQRSQIHWMVAGQTRLSSETPLVTSCQPPMGGVKNSTGLQAVDPSGGSKRLHRSCC